MKITDKRNDNNLVTLESGDVLVLRDMVDGGNLEYYMLVEFGTSIEPYALLSLNTNQIVTTFDSATFDKTLSVMDYYVIEEVISKGRVEFCIH